MSTLKKIAAIALLVFPFFLGNAQDITGIATYLSKTTIDMNRFPKDMPESRKQQILKRIKNNLEKEFTLNFTQDESFYKEIDKLEANTQGGGPPWARGGFTQGGIYKNSKDSTYAQSNTMLSKTFLIQDQISTLDWKLEKESKMIGQYPVFKATAIRENNTVDWRAALRPRRGRGEQEQKNDTVTKAPKKETITAWYTPMIPVGHGPDDYNGLPGLILEINNGRTTMLCSKVVLNPTEGVNIKKPKKGKVVSRTQYFKLIKEKTEELKERYGRNRRGGPGGRRGRQ